MHWYKILDWKLKIYSCVGFAFLLGLSCVYYAINICFSYQNDDLVGFSFSGLFFLVFLRALDELVKGYLREKRSIESEENNAKQQ